MFSAASLKTYVTIVVPRAKKVPGTCVCSRRTAVFESSVACGSIQLMIAPNDSSSVRLMISFGQLSIDGGEISAVKQRRVFYVIDGFRLRLKNNVVCL